MFKRILLIGFLVVVCLVVWKWDRIKGFLNKDVRTTNPTEVKLLLREEPSLEELAQILTEEGIISAPEVLTSFVKENGLTSNYAAGKYVILSGTLLADLVHGFEKNDEGHGFAEVKVKVVFNRCRDIYDVGAQISKCILADSASIVDYALDPATLSKYGFTREQLPALFIPDSYEMYFDLTAEAFVSEMAAIFRSYWTEERKQKMTDIGFSSPSQVVTLASIVYSEQGKVPEEWPVIAGLYLNRLKKGMRLQSDPTFKFCWGDKLEGVQRLLAKHRDIDCPYNTYKIDGLPPGPICLVPKEVVNAVLEPSDVNYLYMCAKPDFSGEHNFTASDAQHIRNARIYQNWLSKNNMR
ncbi:MAG: endolytic transglycosylase MltG [Bacteroidetes bacterium]|nr:MAG: endolytic transglycosylase MltG [Bacteroidota bacterium]